MFLWTLFGWLDGSSDFLIPLNQMFCFRFSVPGLCWFGPASFQSVLRGVNVTAWMTAVPDVPPLSSGHTLLPSQSQSAEEESMAVAPPLQSPPAETEPQVQTEQSTAVDSEEV